MPDRDLGEFPPLTHDDVGEPDSKETRRAERGDRPEPPDPGWKPEHRRRREREEEE